jgi:hypothetical protein
MQYGRVMDAKEHKTADAKGIPVQQNASAKALPQAEAKSITPTNKSEPKSPGRRGTENKGAAAQTEESSKAILSSRRQNTDVTENGICKSFLVFLCVE